MKTKNLLLTGIMGLAMFTACSNEDDVVANNNNGDKATAQIMISVASANGSSRTTTTGDSGDKIDATDSENNIESLTIVLANENDIAQQVINPEMKENTTNKEIRATEPFEVPAGKYKVYVLANYKENSDCISPVIIGSTDMKQTFNIEKTLNYKDAFFMTNADTPDETDFTTEAEDTEVDDDGTEETGGETVHLVEVALERVVSKVTFNNSDNDEFTIKDGNTEIATATLDGVALINLNKKMFMVKNIDDTVTSDAWNGWYYVEDPNYSTVNTDDLTNNFYKYETNEVVFKTPNQAIMYCPENTMAADAQLNGQTTGVVYKVTITPNETNGFVELDKNGTDAYSKIYAEMTNTDVSFTDTESGKSEKTFYAYKGLIFKNKKAAWLYCAIDKNPNNAETEYNNYSDTNAPTDVHEYTDGVCYYTSWIKHNPDATAIMEHGKYGTVRNHWYELEVTGINSLGYYKPTYEKPENPDDAAKAKIQIKATVKKWILVKQSTTLG